MSKLPPCDHDDCPPTHCKGSLSRASCSTANIIRRRISELEGRVKGYARQKNFAKANDWQCHIAGLEWVLEQLPTDVPEISREICDGLSMVASLASEDMAADHKRDWGHAPEAVEFMMQLRKWHLSNSVLNVEGSYNTKPNAQLEHE